MKNPYHKLLGLKQEISAPNYYQLLGLSEGRVSESQLEKGYREHIQKLQRFGHNPKYRDAALYLRGELRASYETLGKPLRKSEYDLALLTRRVEELEGEIKLLALKGYLVDEEVFYLRKKAKTLRIPPPRLKKMLQAVPRYGWPMRRITSYLSIAFGLFTSIASIVSIVYFYPDRREKNQPLQRKTVTIVEKKDIERKIDVPRPKISAKTPVEPEPIEKISDIQVRSKVVYVRSGYFTMGNSQGNFDENPQRRIYLDDYYIGRNEVSNREYHRFIQAVGLQNVPYSLLPEAKDFNWDPLRRTYPKNMGDCPVVLVNWYDALKYCRWLSTNLDGQVTLPTEAQWEKAARGNDGFSYPWGNGIPNGRRSDLGNFYGSRDGFEKLAPVGSFPWGISSCGCWDMAGNASEWCLDTYDKFAYQDMAEKNPCNKRPGSWKVLRGGSWRVRVDLARSSYRNSADAGDRNIRYGFRYAVIPKK